MERMVEVRSHHTGGKTSSTMLPKITSPGVVAARPEHPLPGPKHGSALPHTHTHTHTYLLTQRLSCENVSACNV